MRYAIASESRAYIEYEKLMTSSSIHRSIPSEYGTIDLKPWMSSRTSGQKLVSDSGSFEEVGRWTPDVSNRRRLELEDASTLDSTGVHDSTLDSTGVHDSTLDSTGVHDSTLDSTLDSTGVHDSTLYSTLDSTGVYDSTLVSTLDSTGVPIINADSRQESQEGKKTKTRPKDSIVDVDISSMLNIKDVVSMLMRPVLSIYEVIPELLMIVMSRDEREKRFVKDLKEGRVLKASVRTYERILERAKLEKVSELDWKLQFVTRDVPRIITDGRKVRISRYTPTYSMVIEDCCDDDVDEEKESLTFDPKEYGELMVETVSYTYSSLAKSHKSEPQRSISEEVQWIIDGYFGH